MNGDVGVAGWQWSMKNDKPSTHVCWYHDKLYMIIQLYSMMFSYMHC